jgi:hypothetical protein
MSVKIRLGVLAVLVAVGYGCKKQSGVTPVVIHPAAPTNLPTRQMKGSYLWHETYWYGGSLKNDVITYAIDVISDTAIKISKSGSTGEAIYKYASSNDSEVVFYGSGSKITYKFNRNLIVWDRGGAVLYGVPGATAKWGALNRGLMHGNLHWHHMDVSNSSSDTVRYPDTVAYALALFSNGELTGADSTGCLFENYYYNSGPKEYISQGNIVYSVADDRVIVLNNNVTPVSFFSPYATYYESF